MIRAAIIGVGRMGRRHVQVVRQAGLELVGVFDVSQYSLDLTREEYALPDSVVFDDLSQLYAVGRPEFVIIATTADSHCALVCEAAECGAKYILVEKPMAVSLKQCDQMINVCEARGARLAVNHQMRFMEQYTKPKQLFSTEAYGGLASMTVVAGNFGFSMNGTHYFEAFRFLTDENPVEVAAWFSSERLSNPRGAQFEDRAGCIRAITASGKRLYMEISADQGHGVYAMYACRNGLIVLDELNGNLSSSEREEQYRSLSTTRYGMPSIKKQYDIQPCDVIESTVAVVNAMLSGVNNVSGEHGRQVIELLVAAYQSAEQGGVSISLGNSINRERIFPWA